MSDDQRQEDQGLLKVMVATIVGLAGVVAVLAIVAVVVTGNSGTSAPRQAASAPAAQVTQQPAARTVTVAMHDPGCHWFQVGLNKFGKSETVHGPVVLANNDEAALVVTDRSGTKTDPVGGKVPLAAGTYKITMVGQAPDDNHLKLVVN